MTKNLNRREFLRVSAMTAVGALAASCAQATPQVIEKEVPVEKVVKQTVVVQKEVAIEKVVTATPAEEMPSRFQEAPALAELGSVDIARVLYPACQQYTFETKIGPR